jgi:hypothetical protein
MMSVKASVEGRRGRREVLRFGRAYGMPSRSFFKRTPSSPEPFKDNLLWGNPNATDEEIAKACDVAQVTSFLGDLPDGLDDQTR